MTYTDYKKEFLALLSNKSDVFGERRLFEDFLEVSALAIQNSCLPVESSCWVTNQIRYLEIMNYYNQNAYGKEVPYIFSAMVLVVYKALGNGFCDFLGELYEEVSAKKSKGQFFTPYHVSKMCATMLLGDVDVLLSKKDVIWLNEPSCGCGSMVIACLDILSKKSVDIATRVHFVAQDICKNAINACYIQASFYGASAQLELGNTLDLTEKKKTVYTPMAIKYPKTQ